MLSWTTLEVSLIRTKGENCLHFVKTVSQTQLKNEYEQLVIATEKHPSVRRQRS